MTDDSDRMTALERRLDRIEAALGLSPELTLRPGSAMAESSTTPPVIVQEVSEPVAAEGQIELPRLHVQIEYPSTTPPPLPSAPVRRGTLEETIGLKWTGWAGAIVFVIGAGFLISWLYANGYFGHLPPALRVAAMAGVGFVLISLGEWVYRKFDPRAAAGLYGAGVAVLLLVAYAGHGFYGLYGQSWAYGAMAAATIIGAMVAGRASMVSVGVLAIVGGAIAPLLLSAGPPRPVGFFVYLGALQVVALVLTLRGGDAKWGSLRGTSLLINIVWVAVTMRVPPFMQSAAGSIFCVISAAGFEAEMLAGVRRRVRAETGVVFNLAVTGLLTAALLAMSADAGASAQVAWVVSLAIAAVVMTVACGRSSALRAQSAGYLLQAVGLVAVIAPVALSGEWIAVAWLMWAVGLAVAGRWFDSPATRRVPLLVWAAAVFELMFWSHVGFGQTHDAVVLTVAGEAIDASTVVGLLLGVGGWLLAVLTDSVDRNEGAMPLAATAVWVIAALNGLTAATSTIAVIGAAWILAALFAFVRRPRLLALAGAVLAVAAAKWVVADVLANYLGSNGRSASRAELLSSSSIDSIVLAATVLGIYLWHRVLIDAYLARKSAGSTAVKVAAVVVVVLTFGGSVEAIRWVDRVLPAGRGGFGAAQWMQLSLTAVWTIGLVTFAAAAQWLDTSALVRSGLSLKRCGAVAFCIACKFVVIDTLGFRLLDVPGPGPLLANPRFEVAALLLSAGVLFEWRASRLGGEVSTRARDAGLAAMMVLAVWAGTLEIDQSLSRWTASAEAGHVALSVFWAVSAVIAVTAGFATRRSVARYFGLALLALTLTKVVVVDLSHVQTGLRILSFMALGGLLLLTSVLYGRVSPGRRKGWATDGAINSDDAR